MNNKISKIIQNGKTFISNHSSEILAGLGVSSLITSTILAVKATPKALKLLDEAGNPNDIKDKIKITWREYIPSISFGLSGIVFIKLIIKKLNIKFSKREKILITISIISLYVILIIKKLML